MKLHESGPVILLLNDGSAGLLRAVDPEQNVVLMQDPTETNGDAAVPVDELRLAQLWSGEVLMTTAVNGRITAVNRSEHRNFGIQWTGSLYTVDSWAIMKGSPNAADALKFLNFFGDPKREAQLTEILPYGGLAKGANDGLPPEVLAASPTDPQHLSVSLQIDDAFWRDNLDKLAKRFDAWIAQ